MDKVPVGRARVVEAVWDGPQDVPWVDSGSTLPKRRPTLTLNLLNSSELIPDGRSKTRFLTNYLLFIGQSWDFLYYLYV